MGGGLQIQNCRWKITRRLRVCNIHLLHDDHHLGTRVHNLRGLEINFICFSISIIIKNDKE